MEIEVKPYSLGRRFGIELEFGSNNVDRYVVADRIKTISRKEVRTSSWSPTDKNNDYWHFKTDSSANPESHIRRENGYELASYVGSNLSDLKDVAAVGEHLMNYGCKPNRNCGFHIHLDVSELDNNEVGKIAAWWVRIESWMYKAVPLHRSTSSYCKPLRTFYKDQCKNPPVPGIFWHDIEPRNTSPHDNPYRKLSLNLVNCVGRSRSRARTLELRLPEGTLRGSDITNWVVLFDAFIGNSLKFPYPTRLNSFRNLDPVLTCLGMSDNKTLSNEMLSAKFFFLRRICMYSKFRGKKISYVQSMQALDDAYKTLALRANKPIKESNKVS